MTVTIPASVALCPACGGQLFAETLGIRLDWLNLKIGCVEEKRSDLGKRGKPLPPSGRDVARMACEHAEADWDAACQAVIAWTAQQEAK